MQKYLFLHKINIYFFTFIFSLFTIIIFLPNTNAQAVLVNEYFGQAWSYSEYYGDGETKLIHSITSASATSHTGYAYSLLEKDSVLVSLAASGSQRNGATGTVLTYVTPKFYSGVDPTLVPLVPLDIKGKFGFGWNYEPGVNNWTIVQSVMFYKNEPGEGERAYQYHYRYVNNYSAPWDQYPFTTGIYSKPTEWVIPLYPSRIVIRTEITSFGILDSGLVSLKSYLDPIVEISPWWTVNGIPGTELVYLEFSQASQPIPIPPTIILLGSGLIGVIGRRIFRKG